MLAINISKREEYEPGDLGLVLSRKDDTQWLAEVLRVTNRGYDARLTRLHLNEKTGRYSITSDDSGTYSRVLRNKMQKLRLDNIDFESLANWQKYVDNVRD